MASETLVWNGSEVFDFVRSGTRRGLPWIEGQPLISDLDLVAKALSATFPDHVISTSPELGMKIPGEIIRHARMMAHDAREVPPAELPSGLHFSLLTEADAERYAQAADLAYPPTHPDWLEGQVQQSIDMIHGKVVGPFHPGSSMVEDAQGKILAGALITKFPEAWLSEFFRVPGAPRGTAAALLAHVLTTVGAMSLAVTESNTSAIALYERLGFTTVNISVTVKTGRSEALQPSQ